MFPDLSNLLDEKLNGEQMAHIKEYPISAKLELIEELVDDLIDRVGTVESAAQKDIISAEALIRTTKEELDQLLDIIRAIPMEKE